MAEKTKAWQTRQLLLLAFCLLLLNSLSVAQAVVVEPTGPPGTGPNNDSKKTYSVSGTVVNSVTGEPIARALVLAGIRIQVTTSDGAFEFTGIAQSRIAIQARKPGYFGEQELHPGTPPNIALLDLAESNAPVLLKLIPQAVITGHVSDANGEALENVPVAITSTVIEDGRKQRREMGSGTTDEDGEFRLAGLRPGRYFLSAGPSLGFAYTPYRPAMKLSSGYARTWYSGAQSRSEATPISVTAGQHAEIEMSMQSVPAYLIKAHVLGAPPGVYPSLTTLDSDGEDSSPLSQGFNPENGEFYVVLPRGAFILKAFTQTVLNNQMHTLSARLSLNVSADVDDLVLALRPSTVIPINVRFESTRSDSPYASPQARENPMLHLISADSANRDYYSQPEGPQNANPALRDIEPGKYWVDVLNVNDGYVASLQCGTQNLKREMLTVAEGQRMPPIELVLRDDAGALHVAVRSDRSISRPMQALVVSDQNPQTVTTVVPVMNAGTYYEVGALAPGDYTIYTFDDVSQLEYRNPEVLSAYSSRAVHVSVAPNSQSNVMLDPIRTEQ